MKKIVCCIIMGVILVGVSVSILVKANSSTDLIMKLTMESIEGLAEYEGGHGSGTRIDDCVLNSGFTERDWTGTWFKICDERTTTSYAYPCGSLKEGYKFDRFYTCTL